MIAPSLARFPVLFRWNVNDGLNGQKLLARSFATELEGVLTRTSTKYVRDRNGVLVPLPRDLPPIDWDGGLGLLLEPQRTNLCIRSEEFDTWSLTNTTVTANAKTAPDGAVTMDLLNATVAGGFASRVVTFTADGEKCVAIFLSQGTSSVTTVSIFDSTAAATRHAVTVTWTAGVPSLATASGSGTLYPVEWTAQGWRILFSVAAVVAANTNNLRVFGGGSGGTGSTFAWGAQAENAVVPSSYIPTAASTVTRNADSLYFPFTAPPQAMTVYVRGVERGTGFTPNGDLFSFGNAAGTGARLQVSSNGSNDGRLFARWTDGASNSNSVIAGAGAVGQMQEYRTTLSALGVAQLGRSINSAVETVATAGAAVALTGSFSDTRLYLNSRGSVQQGQFAFTHVVVAAGEQSLATMRELAGV